MIDLKAKPFFLHDEDIRWVEETLTSMTLEQKAGQVFCPMGFSADPGLLRHLVNDIGVGGMMYRPSRLCRRDPRHPPYDPEPGEDPAAAGRQHRTRRGWSGL